VTVIVREGKLFDCGDGAKSWPLAGTASRAAVSSSKSMELVGLDLWSTYAALYTGQPWIYSLVNKMSRNIARLPLMTYGEEIEQGTRTPLRAHPLALLLSRPYPRGSRFKLVEATIGSLAVYGHALWWKYRPRPGMAPVELWPIDWRYVTMQTGKDVPIDYYEYRGPAGRKVFFPDDVVHFEWWSPVGTKGTSPLEPLRVTLSIEDAARRYSVASFANGIRPSGALVSPKPIPGPDREELKKEIRAVHENPDNAFRMLLLDAGLDWKQFGMSAVDGELINLRKINREEACAVYDMPPPMVQILDHATFSNIDEQHQMLYIDTLGPWIGNFTDTVGSQLIWGEPEFALSPAGEPVVVDFDMNALLKVDIAKRAEAYTKMRIAGAYTANDVRAAEGKPRIEHEIADAILIPLNVSALTKSGIRGPLGESAGGATQAQAALASLAQALQDVKDGEIKAAVEAMADLAADVGRENREVAQAVLEVAKKLADQAPPEITFPELKFVFEEGAFKTELGVAAPAAPELIMAEGDKSIELVRDEETGRVTGARIVNA
jgi:HK97 family phage portal protein